jgi:hypothetical protein
MHIQICVLIACISIIINAKYNEYIHLNNNLFSKPSRWVGVRLESKYKS